MPSRIIALGGSRHLAIAASVLVQMSYHLYQGFTNCVLLVPMFGVLSVYYAYSRRIVPVVLVHLAFDLLALLTGAL